MIASVVHSTVILHDSLFLGLVYILVVLIKCVKWANLQRHREWEKLVQNSYFPPAVAAIMHRFYESSLQGNGLLNRIYTYIWHLEPETWQFPNGKQSDEKQRGLGEGNRNDRFGAIRNIVAPINLVQWCRSMDVWLCASFASLLLGISLTSTSLVTKAAIHIQFSFCVRIVHV